MIHADAINQAIQYIDHHLTDRLSTEIIADQAGFSPTHFNRLFLAATRSTLADYVRRRRLSASAYDLLGTNRPILDIAISYHFESQESYTRAFKKQFLITPGQFRKQGDPEVTLFRVMEKKPLMPEKIAHIQSLLNLDPAVRAIPEIYAMGLARHSSTGSHFQSLWEQFLPRLFEVDETDDGFAVRYGVIEPTGDRNEYHYIACAPAGRAKSVPEGMREVIIPAGQYAVFTHQGSIGRLRDTYQFIYSSWLPRSGWIRAQGPEFEVYSGEYGNPHDEQFTFEICIPVQKKEFKD